MAFCNERGIPHSVFLGRVVGPGEPQWLPEDRAKAIAAVLEKGEVCGRCHTADWQWEEDPHAFEPVKLNCKGCYVLRKAEEGERESTMPGDVLVLVPKAVAAKLRHDAARRKRPQRRRRRE